MSRSRRLFLAPAAAAAIALAGAGAALAGTPVSAVFVFNEDGSPAGATVCAFYVEFGAVEGGESGSWALFDSSDATVESGTYEVTSGEVDRHPASGTFSVPNGTYVLAWDDEPQIDRSRGEVEITVECAAATEAPAPTEAPTEGPAQETVAPTAEAGGDVGGATPLPTLPPTSTDSAPRNPGLSGLLVLLGLVLGAVAVVTPRPHRSPR
ncbi:MAG: hypothetical protein FIA92_02640 [Chloroflexi bacterium]|nr:hypothetical protein [Chloroflexota bacterium]